MTEQELNDVDKMLLGDPVVLYNNQLQVRTLIELDYVVCFLESPHISRGKGAILLHLRQYVDSIGGFLVVGELAMYP